MITAGFNSGPETGSATTDYQDITVNIFRPG